MIHEAYFEGLESDNNYSKLTVLILCVLRESENKVPTSNAYVVGELR